MLRPATDADLDAIAELGIAEETGWFGAPESSVEEIAEYVEHHGGVAQAVVDERDGVLSAFGVVSPTGESLMFLAPDAGREAFERVRQWLVERGVASLEVFAGDERRIAWLEAAGWEHRRSAFDLARARADPLEAPVWPAGVEIETYDAQRDAEDVHRLVYVDAAWAEVSGHVERSLETWRSMQRAANSAWVARRDGRPVGFATGRILESGRGWIFQIAVARTERRGGLGRALLLHTYQRLLEQGASSLGLGVQAANAGALGLYRSIGLEVEREFRVFMPQAPGLGTGSAP